MAQKKIILIDRTFRVAEEILTKRPDVTIAALVASPNDKENILQNRESFNRVNLVYTIGDIDLQTGVEEIDHSFINDARGIQEKIQASLYRYSDDINEIKLRYYRVLSFWEKIFRQNDICCVICNQTCHGLLYDGLCIYLALMKGIPAYTANPTGLDWWYISDMQKSIPIEAQQTESIHDASDILSSPDGKYDVMNFDMHTNVDKMKAVSVLYHLFGFHFIDFCRACIHRSITKMEYISPTGFQTSYAKRSRSYKWYKKLKKYVYRIGEMPDYKINYIYFPLQFEPEGGNINLTIDSQLALIEMIAGALPEGWEVYVKEHPHQYMLEEHIFYYYINHIENFKTRYFYQEIMQMKHVKLIRINTPSKDLIRNAAAVASRLGSAMFESILEKKPVLLMEKNHPLWYDKEILSCVKRGDLNNAFETLLKGYHPQYKETVSVFNKYCVREKDLSGNFLRLI